MDAILFGITAGLIFGIVDIIPMYFMKNLENKRIAMLGAFSSSFAIGFVIPISSLPMAGWLKGLLLGILLRLPDAIIAGAWAPIMGTGIIGGALIGLASEFLLA